MRLKYLKTERRLWFWISLGLFIVPWFLPILRGKRESVAPGFCWWVLFNSRNHAGEALSAIAVFSALFGSLAVTIGWIAQAVIMTVRDAGRGE